jgi:hypothetical protein
VISPSQGHYLHTGQRKHRINAYTDIHVLSGIRIHDPSVRASEDSSCLSPRGHCDLHNKAISSNTRSVSRIQLTQNEVQDQAVVNMVMRLSIP